MTEETPAQSQERWLAVRRYMREHRTELAHAAAALYPDIPKVDDTDLLVPRHWLPTKPIPLDQVVLEWQPDAVYQGLDGTEDVSTDVRPLRSDGRRYQRYTDAMADLAAPSTFENRPSYRLLSADLTGDPARLVFGRGHYFDAVNVGEAAGHEFAATRVDGGTSLPLREAIGDPTDPARRPMLMAITTLTLRVDRATGEVTFLLHWRDPAKVAHAGGLYQVVPVGLFQPSGSALANETNDFDLWRNTVREYAEELLGGSEDYGAGPIDYYAWPLYRQLTDLPRARAVRPYVLGLGVDPLTFATDLLTVVAFDATAFDELFAQLVAENAEGTIRAMPFTSEMVTRFTRDEPMQTAGAATLWSASGHQVGTSGGSLSRGFD